MKRYQIDDLSLSNIAGPVPVEVVRMMAAELLALRRAEREFRRLMDYRCLDRSKGDITVMEAFDLAKRARETQ